MKLAFHCLAVAVLCLVALEAAAQVPVIDGFAPNSGRIGISVTISGSNFSPLPGSNSVYFGAVAALVTEATTNSLIVTVPAGATYRPITVTSGGLTAASKSAFLPTFRGGPSFQTDGFRLFSTDRGEPSNLLVGDFDGDGKPDVATTAIFSGIAGFGLFQNTTAGSSSVTFAPMAPLYPYHPESVNQGPIAQTIADLDGDGKLDLLLSASPNFLLIYRNISSPGSLTAASFADPVVLDLQGNGYDVAVADFDGDGRPEILVTIGGTISVFQNLSSPGVINSNSFPPPVAFTSEYLVTALAVADFDMDGKLDVAGLTAGGVALLRNISTGPGIAAGSFASPEVVNLAPGSYATFAAGDIDGDGRADLVIMRGYSPSTAISIRRNLTSGPGLSASSFGDSVEIFSGPSTPNGGALDIADVNGDGKVDLVVLFRHDLVDSSFRVFLNTGSPGAISEGSFVSGGLFSVSPEYYPRGIAVADVDNDGRPDILLPRYAGNGGYSPRGYLAVYHNSTPPPPNEPPTVSIISPTNGSVFVTPVDIAISADAGDADGTVSQVLFWAGSDLVGVSSTWPFTITWSNVLAGNYILTASAMDDSGNATVSAGVAIIVNGPPVAPSITVPPQSQSVPLGSNATFTVTASGTSPLSFQWFINGTNPLSVTSATLNLTNVQFAQTGDYSVYVSNSAGSVTSAPARLTVVPPGGRLVQALNSSGMPGATVRVPIVLVGQDDENAVGFSVGFPNSLSYVSAELGEGATNATLNLNDGQAASGRLGLSLALSAGASFPAGTQELVVVTFAIAPEIGNTTATISFHDQPVVREISDALANSLSALFGAATVTISGGGYEGDVSPAPDGNGAITVTDWVKVGRYAAGLDVIGSASQFQRADCAPRSTLGNGAITVTDWVQAGRYAAGLDSLTSAGGPTGPSAPGDSFATARIAGGVPGRELRLPRVGLVPGETNGVSVLLIAEGNESAVGFSVSFHPLIAVFVDARLGASSGGAVMNVNRADAASGLVGVALSLPIGKSFAPGTQEVAVLRFAAPLNATADTLLKFTNGPVREEISDTLGNSVTTSFSPGFLQIMPRLSISRAGPNNLLTWPSWGAAFLLEASDVLSPNSLWVPATTLATNTVSNEIRIMTPASSARQFFRLRLP